MTIPQMEGVHPVWVSHPKRPPARPNPHVVIPWYPSRIRLYAPYSHVRSPNRRPHCRTLQPYRGWCSKVRDGQYDDGTWGFPFVCENGTKGDFVLLRHMLHGDYSTYVLICQYIFLPYFPSINLNSSYKIGDESTGLLACDC